jgi:hypothetical protein
LYLFVVYIFLERPVNLHEDAISLKAQKQLNNGQHLVPNKFRAYPEKIQTPTHVHIPSYTYRQTRYGRQQSKQVEGKAQTARNLGIDP